MIASESTAFTLDRTGRFSCNALQPRSDHAGRRSDFDVIIIGGSVPMLPIDCTPLISVQRIQKKQPTATRYHATHN
jgi:hypothetical protein